jgi:drug/metabolite transporter (DMT)-like permease
LNASELRESTAPCSALWELASGSLLLVLVWGITQPTIKAAYAGMSPFALIWIRSVLSVLTISAWRFFAGVSDQSTQVLPQREKAHRIINGCLHNSYILFLYLGMTGTQASRASVLLYTQPIWVMLISALFLSGEHISPRRGIGFLIAMTGTVAIFSHRLGGESALWADSFVVISAMLWACQAIHFKRYLSRSDVYAVTRWGMLIGAPLYFTLTFVAEDGGRYAFGVPQVYAIFHMGLVSSGMVLVLWAHLMRKFSPARVSVFLFLTPVVGVAVSALWLGEVIESWFLAGAGMTIFGVWLVTTERRG